MQKIIEAKELYPKLCPNRSDADGQDQALANQQARYRHVSAVLSPEEMVYYTLAEEDGALCVESLLQPIHPSPEELLAVGKVAANLDCNIHNGQFTPETDEKLRATLSPERYSLLNYLSAPEYWAVEFCANMMKISNQQREQLIELRRSYKTLDATAYRARVGEILKQEPPIQDYLQHPLIHPNR